MTTLLDALLRVAADHPRQVEEHLAAAAELTAPAERGDYLEHCALAFAHQWCALLEAPGSDQAQVSELIDDQTELSASDGRIISGVDEIVAWFEATACAVEHTAHTITGLRVEGGPDDEIRVTLDFAWQGLTATQQAMRARTHHEWTLVDRPARLPVLRTFHVDIVEPFTPTTEEDALAFLEDVTA